MINALENIALKLLRLMAAVAFVDAVYLFNSGMIKGAVMLIIIAVLVWKMTSKGYLK